MEAPILYFDTTVLDDYGITIDSAETGRDFQDIRKQYSDNNSYCVMYEEQKEVVGSNGIYRMSETICKLRKM